MCIAVVAFPGGVFAAATASSVTVADPTHPKQKAHVSGGKLLAGDGSGALMVNGGVSVTGTAAVSGTVSTHSSDKTVALYSGSLVAGQNSTTVATAAYGTIRVSVENPTTPPVD